MANTIISIPERGDICVLDAEKNIKYITFDSFDLSALPSGWTVIAPVEWRRGRKVKVNRVLGNYKWAQYFLWLISDYVMDGESHPFSFAVTVSGTTYTCSGNYSGTTVAEVAASMNAVVKDFAFGNQQYHVYVRNGELILSHDTYASYLAVTPTGVKVAARVGTEIAATTAILRLNGHKTGDGAVINLDRALIYFRADNSSATYNPTSELTSIKRGYPVCLPAYLGTSPSRVEGGVQKDYCGVLRAYYGEGEEGWINFMRTGVFAVRPSCQGIDNTAIYGDGPTNTYKLAGQTIEDHDGNSVPFYPAFDAVSAVAFDADGLRAGDWYIPRIGEIVELKRGITYPAKYVTGSGSVNVAAADADLLTRAYDKCGLTQIANNTIAWSSSRGGTGGAWSFSGGIGSAGYGSFGYNSQTVASALLSLPEAD